jgi:predicted hotdog family 3-hydroxylacyl-ACP dehydratase
VGFFIGFFPHERHDPMTTPPGYPDIEHLLPHRGRMLLIDEVVEIDGNKAVSRATPNARWPLSDGSQVSPLMVIELVAQTCGLSNGMEWRSAEGRKAEIKGFLVGVKKATFHVRSLPLGEAILTETRNTFAFEGFREIEGTCKSGETIIGEAVLQVVRAD